MLRRSVVWAAAMSTAAWWISVAVTVPALAAPPGRRPQPPHEREAPWKKQRPSPFDPRGEIHIPIGVPNTLDTLKTFVEPEGDFSPGVGSYGVYYWVYDESARRLVAPTADGVKVDYGLSPEGFLIPWSQWSAGAMVIRSELCEVQRPSPQGEVFVVGARVRLRNTAGEGRKLALCVALRPLGPAGFPVRKLEVSRDGNALSVDGHPAIVAHQKATAAGVSVTDTIGETIAEGCFPMEKQAESARGTCSGACASI